MPTTTTTHALRDRLVAWRNPDGGWGYLAGNRSRLEPTCPATLCDIDGGASRALSNWASDGRFLVDGAGIPANVGFNGLALFVLMHSEGAEVVWRLAAALTELSGKSEANSEVTAQDNSLRGWPWVDGNFSWVEPPAWCLLSMKRWRRQSRSALPQLDARIDEADRHVILVSVRCTAAGGEERVGRPCHLGGTCSARWPRCQRSVLSGVSACRRRANTDQGTLRSAVVILPARDYSEDLSDLVSRALNELGVDVRGKCVLVKPNMVEFDPTRPINTHPAVIGGTVVALHRAGAEQVIVGEGPCHRRDIEFLLQSTGLMDVLDSERIDFVDLNHDDIGWMALKGGQIGSQRVAMPPSVLAADLVVSLPRLKTHHWTGMTAPMKNLFGTVPGAVYGWPKNPVHYAGIGNSILDLTASIPLASLSWMPSLAWKMTGRFVVAHGGSAQSLPGRIPWP